MRKISFVLTAAMTFIISCQKNIETRLTGTIENYTNSSLLLFDMSETFLPDTIPVINGKFSIPLEIKNPTFKFLELGIKQGGPMVFIAPGYSLKVLIKNNNYNNYKLIGKGSLENAILDSILAVQTPINWEWTDKQRQDIAFKYIDSVYNRRYIKLNELVKSKHPDPLFIEYAKAVIIYEAILIKQTLGLRNKINDPGYYSFLKDIDLENETHLEVPGYARVLLKYIEIEVNKSVPYSKLISYSPEEILNTELKVIEKFKNKQIFEYLLYYKISQLLKYDGIRIFEKYNKYFNEHNTNPNYATKINNAYSSYKLLLGHGKPAPPLSGFDIDSNRISLSDFKDRYIYLCFWAENALQYRESLSTYIKLQSDYKDYNISFLDISLNEDKKAWKKAVYSNKFLGTSLFYDKEIFLKYSNPYKIMSFPRFALIAPNGKIIDAHAPFPYTIEIRKMFDTLLVKNKA